MGAQKKGKISNIQATEELRDGFGTQYVYWDHNCCCYMCFVLYKMLWVIWEIILLHSKYKNYLVFYEDKTISYMCNIVCCLELGISFVMRWECAPCFWQWSWCQ